MPGSWARVASRQLSLLLVFAALVRGTPVVTTTLAGDYTIGDGPPGNFGHADGTGTGASFYVPYGVALHPSGSYALVADCGNNVLRRVEIATASVSTFVGGYDLNGEPPNNAGYADGMGTAASLYCPIGITFDSAGSFALFTDAYSNTIRRVDLSSRTTTTLAGSAGSPGVADGVGTNALFTFPVDVAVDMAGSFALIADVNANTIRRLDLSSGAVSTLAGTPGVTGFDDGVGTAATFTAPGGVAVNAAGTFALVADIGNNAIRRIDISSGTVTTLAGSPVQDAGSYDGVGRDATFSNPRSISMDATETYALIAELGSSIRRIDLETLAVSTLAGNSSIPGHDDGVGTTATFNAPYGISLSRAGTFAVVADSYNNAVRYISISPAQSTTSTQTLSASSTSSSTATRTRSSSSTRSASSTRSSTRSATASRTRSAQPSRTRSATASRTSSSTATATRSPLPSQSRAPITNVVSNKPRFDLASAVAEPGRLTSSVGCYSIFGGADQGSQVATAVAFRTNTAPSYLRAFYLNIVRIVLKRAPGAPPAAMSQFFYAFYSDVNAAPGTLLTTPSPVIPSTPNVSVTDRFNWYGINVAPGAGSVAFAPNTTYWFALFPPAATVNVSAAPAPGAVTGVLLGGNYDPYNVLPRNSAYDRKQFTTVELGSERWAGDSTFACASPSSTGSLLLRGQSNWARADGRRFRRPDPNPTGFGPLRIGLDITTA